jgi:hypothetical protein
MKVWLIFLQDEVGAIWLEAAWDDDSIAENRSGWEDEVDRVRQIMADNRGYSMRLMAAKIPGVFELFEIPEVNADAL